MVGRFPPRPSQRAMAYPRVIWNWCSNHWCAAASLRASAAFTPATTNSPPFLSGVAPATGYNVLALNSWLLGNVLDIEASDLAASKTKDVSDRLVFKPVRLPLERFAFEIADRLPDFCDDRAIRSSMKAHRLDVRTDHSPLARPVLAYGLAAMDVATLHVSRFMLRFLRLSLQTLDGNARVLHRFRSYGAGLMLNRAPAATRPVGSAGGVFVVGGRR